MILRMPDDLMDDLPEPPRRFVYRVPWGIVFLLALIPVGALILLLVV